MAEPLANIHRRPQHHNDNPESAIQDFFDSGLDITKYGYSSGAPRSQIEAAPPTLELPANSWDELTSLGQSRPPSRVAGSWDEKVTQAQSTGVIGIEDDDDLQRAMAMSLQDAPSGVQLRTTVAITVPDPDPQYRERQQGTPVFLKPLGRAYVDFLPSFLTIIHSIPQCRNQLLSLNDLQSQYPPIDNWWQGEEARVSRVFFEGDLASPGNEVVHETQRVMAFLDASNRAYGSAEALSKSSRFDGPTSERTNASEIISFLSHWEQAIRPDTNEDGHDVLPSLFRSRITKTSQEPQEPLAIYLESEGPSSLADANLYDMLDVGFYTPDDQAPYLLQTVAPILIMSLPVRSPASKVDAIPLELYLDRYLETNADNVAHIRNNRTSLRNQINSIDDKIERLSTFKYRRSTALVSGSAEKLYGSVRDYIHETIEDPGPETFSAEEKTKRQALLHRLDQISKHIHGRVEALNAERSVCENQLGRLRRALADPTFEDAPPNTDSKHLLHGVAVMQDCQHSEIYVLKPLGPNEMQWWQLSYVVEYGDARVTSTEVTPAYVQEVASTTSYQTLLIFVRPDVLEARPDDLPGPLRDFVASDNEAFRTELDRSRQYVNPQVFENQPSWDQQVSWQDGATDTQTFAPPPDFTEHQDARPWSDYKQQGNEAFPTFESTTMKSWSDDGSDDDRTGGVHLIEHASTGVPMELDSQQPAAAPLSTAPTPLPDIREVSINDLLYDSAVADERGSPSKRKSVDPSSEITMSEIEVEDQSRESEGQRLERKMRVKKASPPKKLKREDSGEQ